MKPKISLLALQSKWYRRLEKSGFTDIENHQNGALKSWSGHFVRMKRQDSAFYLDQIEETDQYFTSAREVLHWYEFESKYERLVWELHCKGYSTRQISNEIGNTNHVAIYKIIKKIQESFLGNFDRHVINDVLYRPGVLSDANFIYATWLRTLYYDTRSTDEVDKDSFMKVMTKRINFLLCQPDTVVTIASQKDDPDVILGYAVMNGDKLWWVYVKKAWRQMGIAKRLVPGHIDCCAYITDSARDIKPPGWRVIPYFKEELE